jgi:elongation factor Ts
MAALSQGLQDMRREQRDGPVIESERHFRPVGGAPVADYGGRKTFTTQNGFIQGYNHNCGRIGALVEITCEKVDLTLRDIGKELAMQIAASKPLFIDRADVPVEILEKEKQIFKSEASGKPEAIVDKIVSGKMERFFKEKCLVEQVWIKNEEMTIADYLREQSLKLKAAVKVVRFARFERGEGLEKRFELPEIGNRLS